MRTVQKITLILGVFGLVVTFFYTSNIQDGRHLEKRRSNTPGYINARVLVEQTGKSAPRIPDLIENQGLVDGVRSIQTEEKAVSNHFMPESNPNMTRLNDFDRSRLEKRRRGEISHHSLEHHTRKARVESNGESAHKLPPPRTDKTEHDVQGVRPCAMKSLDGSSSFVCVCNATYCDQIPTSTIGMLSTTYNVMTSTKTGDRLTQRQYKFSQKANKTGDSVTYSLKKRTILQAVLGFGGAFTDAATINIMKLSRPAQDKLIKSYFGTEGIRYSLGRIPIASCDFSTREYSYDDHKNDFELKNFTLAMEDTKYKIPVILRSLNESGIYVRLFASPWSAPGWMKDSGEMKGKGRLIGDPGGKYYKTWANYFVKFIQEYKNHGIDIWGLTIENEPSAGNLAGWAWQAMYFSPEMERDFIKMDLGPALKANGYGNVALMILDDQRYSLPQWVNPILNDPEASSYVSGIGVHWYWDTISPASVLSETHVNHPSKFLLGTEACSGSGLFEQAVILGSWERGEDYSHDIIEDLNNWVTGWVDWNIALDLQGGPNWVQNYVDSPIIVDTENDVFYKQPMYYHMGHFSKYVDAGSWRIDYSADKETTYRSLDVLSKYKRESNADLSVTRCSKQIQTKYVDAGSWRIDYSADKETTLESFIVQQADLSFVAVFLNRKDEPINIHIEDPLDSDRGVINAQVPARAIQTYHWKPSHTDRAGD